MIERLVMVAGLGAVVGCATGGESELFDTTEVYRIESLSLPESFADVRRVAFDLDGDGRRENAAGSTLMSFFVNFDSAAAAMPDLVNAALAEVEWQVTVEIDRASGVAEVLSVHGAGAEADAVPATILADVIGDWPVGWVAPTGVAGDLALRGGALVGRIGFALPQSSLVALAEPMARYFTQRLQAGELVMTALMDVDQDGVISTDEFLDHELVKQLLQPDVDLIGGDGVLDSWSGAFDVRAVPPGVGAPDVD